MKRLTAALVALLCLAGAACADAPALARRTYAAYGFSVGVPQGWQEQEMMELGADALFEAAPVVVADMFSDAETMAVAVVAVIDMIALTEAGRAAAMDELLQGTDGITHENGLRLVRDYDEAQGGGGVLVLGDDCAVLLAVYAVTPDTLLEDMLDSFAWQGGGGTVLALAW